MRRARCFAPWLSKQPCEDYVRTKASVSAETMFLHFHSLFPITWQAEHCLSCVRARRIGKGLGSNSEKQFNSAFLLKTSRTCKENKRLLEPQKTKYSVGTTRLSAVCLFSLCRLYPLAGRDSRYRGRILDGTA